MLLHPLRLLQQPVTQTQNRSIFCCWCCCDMRGSSSLWPRPRPAANSPAGGAAASRAAAAASLTSDPPPILLWGMLLQHPLRLLRLRHARLQQHQPVTPTRPAACSATDAASSDAGCYSSRRLCCGSKSGLETVVAAAGYHAVVNIQRCNKEVLVVVVERPDIEAIVYKVRYRIFLP